MAEEDELAPILGPINRYLAQMTGDPLRLSVLAAHALIEEMIENVIAGAGTELGVLQRSTDAILAKTQNRSALTGSDKKNKVLWTAIEKLNKLRNAAAHKDYEKLRDERFVDLANFFYPDPAFRAARSRETLLHELATACAGFLAGMQSEFRHLRQGS